MTARWTEFATATGTPIRVWSPPADGVHMVQVFTSTSLLVASHDLSVSH